MIYLFFICRQGDHPRDVHCKCWARTLSAVNTAWWGHHTMKSRPAFFIFLGNIRDTLWLEKCIEHAQNFFLGPTFEQKCKTFTEHYINAMKLLTSLDYCFSCITHTLINTTKTFSMLLVIVGDTPIVDIIANLNTLELSKLWASAGVSRHSVTSLWDRYWKHLAGLFRLPYSCAYYLYVK